MIPYLDLFSSFSLMHLDPKLGLVPLYLDSVGCPSLVLLAQISCLLS